MILRLSSAAARGLLVVFSFLLCITLSYFGLRNARAAYNANLDTQQGYERAVQLEPKNARNWYLLGRYWEFNLEQPDTPRAIQAFRTALSLDRGAADTWLDLGAAYESEDNLPAARDAYQQAKRVYPASAEVAWAYGNFLLRERDFKSAFQEIKAAVESNPSLGGQAFSRCWRVNPDVDVILYEALPPNRDVYLAAIRALGEDGELDAALKVWQKLVALHPVLTLQDAYFFTDRLIQRGRMQDALRVWTDAVSLLANPPPPDPPHSVVWDGGFESSAVGGGFAWDYGPLMKGVEIRLDSSEKHSGNQSLRLGFDGKENLSFDGVCKEVAVEPSTTYLFSAWILTKALTSSEGVRFRLLPLSDPSATVETPDVRGTQPWTKVETRWTAGSNVSQLRICIARDASDQPESNIRGTAWVDDVALIPANRESAKP